MGTAARKISRKLRRYVKQERWVLFNQMCDDSLGNRIKLAARILFRRKFGKSTQGNQPQGAGMN